MKKKFNLGFTLIELIVAIAIMVLILAVILVNYKKFDSGIIMTNLAYDIALSIRTAQTYGVSVKSSKTSTGNFETPYGIHFDLATPTTYWLFVDNNDNHDNTYGNGIFDTSINAESSLATTYNLRGAYYIKSLCYVFGSGNCTACNKLDITFRRPNPDAIMSANDGTVSGSNISAVKIVIGSKQDVNAQKTITVQQTGQISVQ